MLGACGDQQRNEERETNLKRNFERKIDVAFLYLGRWKRQRKRKVKAVIAQKKILNNFKWVMQEPYDLSQV